MSDFEAFLLAIVVVAVVFVTVVFLHTRCLRKHTEGWVPTTAEVLKLVNGGDAQNYYHLQYMFDGKTYRTETGPLLFPSCSAKTGSQITILVNPANPRQCATSTVRKGR